MKLNNLVLSAVLSSITYAVELNRDILDITSKVNNLGYHELNQVVPRVVVIGDQSSAKSSFVEALTGFQMPKGDGETTTVAPIQLVTKKDPRVNFKATITSDKEREKVDSLDMLSNKIEEFQLKSLSNWKNSSNEHENDRFSEYPVSVEIQGKTVKDMVITDMPGFVKTEGNIDQIMEMINKQLNNSASVVVATRECRNTVAATNDAISAEKEMELKDKGKRTLHIITKPDNCNTMELKKFLEKKFLEKGSEYYVVYTHPAVLNNSTTEEAFFKNNAPEIMIELYDMYPERFGIKHVANALSKALNEQFGKHSRKILRQLELKEKKLTLDMAELTNSGEKTTPIWGIASKIASRISYVLGIDSGSSTKLVSATDNDLNSFVDLANYTRDEVIKRGAKLRYETQNTIPFYSITRPIVNSTAQRVSKDHAKANLEEELGKIKNVFFQTYNTEQFLSGTFEHVLSAVMNSVALQRANDAMQSWENLTAATLLNVAEEYKSSIRNVVEHSLKEFLGNTQHEDQKETIDDLLTTVELQVDTAARFAKTHAEKIVRLERVRRMNSNTQLLEVLVEYYSAKIRVSIGEKDTETLQKAVKEVAMVGSASAGAYSIALSGAKVAGSVAETAANAAAQTVFPVVPKMFGQAVGSAVMASITGMAIPAIGTGSLAYIGLRIAHEAGKMLHETYVDWKKRKADVDYSNGKNFESAVAYVFKKELAKSTAKGNVESFTFDNANEIPNDLALAVLAQETAFLHYSHSRVNDAARLAMNHYMKNNLRRTLENSIEAGLSRSDGVHGPHELYCINRKDCENRIKEIQEAVSQVYTFINTNKRSKSQ